MNRESFQVDEWRHCYKAIGFTGQKSSKNFFGSDLELVNEIQNFKDFQDAGFMIVLCIELCIDDRTVWSHFDRRLIA